MVRLDTKPLHVFQCEGKPQRKGLDGSFDTGVPPRVGILNDLWMEVTAPSQNEVAVQTYSFCLDFPYRSSSACDGILPYQNWKGILQEKSEKNKAEIWYHRESQVPLSIPKDAPKYSVR